MEAINHPGRFLRSGIGATFQNNAVGGAKIYIIYYKKRQILVVFDPKHREFVTALPNVGVGDSALGITDYQLIRLTS
jgi:hypothetical protein